MVSSEEGPVANLALSTRVEGKHAGKSITFQVFMIFNSFENVCIIVHRGAKQGGGVGGVSTPPEFWMGGLNTCQPPLILRNFFLGGLAPLKLI